VTIVPATTTTRVITYQGVTNAGITTIPTTIPATTSTISTTTTVELHTDVTPHVPIVRPKAAIDAP
jgi:hypothetical protein